MTTSGKVSRRVLIHRSDEWWRALFLRFVQSGQTGEQFYAEQGLALAATEAGFEFFHEGQQEVCRARLLLPSWAFLL